MNRKSRVKVDYIFSCRKIAPQFLKDKPPPPPSKPVLSKRGWGEREGERERGSERDISIQAPLKY